MYFLRMMVFFFIFFFSSIVCAAETYKLDPLHTYVLWRINHLGFSTQSGKWMADGNLVLDEKNPENSKVTAIIRVANMITGIPELDKHLKAPLFFNVKKFPLATFVSNKVIVTGEKTAKVEGILTVHGVAKPVTLDVTLNKLGANPVSDKEGAGFSATTKINRSDFGIATLLPVLGNEVDLNIEVEAYK